MKLAIMQPYFLPYIGYFQLIKAVDKFIIYDDVNFIKKGWINRNNLLVNGQPFLFSVPLIKASQNRKINEIKMVESQEWHRKLLKTININYKKAPYFYEASSLIEKIFSYKTNNISDYATNALKIICQYLGITTEIIPSSTIYRNSELIGKNRIIDICLKENASIYINASGGKKLYDETSFLENNIELKFICGELPMYRQFEHDFIGGLSILDVLMFNSRENIEAFIQNYRLD
ncbi:MAG: WbqC family protein [Colwellia sp.]|nr:WbqC family protein [Colwellia sp.]